MKERLPKTKLSEQGESGGRWASCGHVTPYLLHVVPSALQIALDNCTCVIKLKIYVWLLVTYALCQEKLVLAFGISRETKQNES